MASFISPIRENYMTGARNPRSTPNRVAFGDSPALRRDATFLGTASFSGDSAYDVAGQFLGEIDELVLEVRSGRIAYAIVAVGGFWGMGRRLFAVPWRAITVDRAFQRCVVGVDRQRLIGAPSLVGDILQQMTDPRWALEVHAHFGCKPYWE